MAYSLNDLYRTLRVVMRFNGLLLGVGLGIWLLIFPHNVMAALPGYSGTPVWPVRLAGTLLLSQGTLLLLSAQERIINSAAMLAMLLANGLGAIVLLVSYLQGEFAGLGLVGQIVLVALFLCCLISAIVPLRYLRTDYVVL